jgi:hypothetical protein
MEATAQKKVWLLTDFAPQITLHFKSCTNNLELRIRLNGAAGKLHRGLANARALRSSAVRPDASVQVIALLSSYAV